MSNIKKVLSIIIVAFFMAGLMPALPVSASNTTYYVDSVSGNDSNNGTSTASAWKTLGKVNSVTFQAGDKILFKRGSSWTGQLHPLGSGSSGSPIVIDAYGSGRRPIINGGGVVGGAVYLYNQQYWEVKNLEVTNVAAPNSASRQGILIKAENAGTLHYIRILDCYVHNVNGYTDNNQGWDPWNSSGGIIFEVGVNTTSYTYFDDVLIENCNSSYNDSNGIFMVCLSYHNGLVYKAFTNVVIRNNVVDHNAGNGIVVCFADSQLIEHNVASYNHYGCPSNACVGIWPYYSDDATLQYNEAYGTQSTWDGQAYDCDYGCNDTLFQYNYSHDNVGGFMLICYAAYNESPVIRYNISQNDGSERIFSIAGHVTNAKIYNNTIYVGEGRDPMVVHTHGDAGDSGTWPYNFNFNNNIFYIDGKATYFLNFANNFTFDYNTFYGDHDATEPSDAHKLTTDPMLVDPGSGRIGRDSVDGYKLETNSPSLGSGVLISSNGGEDYWGNIVSATQAPNRGAYNGSGVSNAPIITSQATWTRVDDTDSSISYTGSWTFHAHDSGYYWDSRHYASTSNTYLSYGFTGTGVRVLGDKAPDNGKFDVWLDGVYKATIDCYSTSYAKQVILYEISGLIDGWHLVTVKHRGWKNDFSSGYYVSMDAFEYQSAPTVNDSIIRNYKLDESSGTTASDTCGNYNGTVSGTASWVTGYDDNGINLNGSSGYVNVGNPAIGTSDFTVSAWIKRDASKLQQIVAQEKSGVTGNQWRLYLTADNKLGFTMSNGSGTSGGLPIETTDTIPADTWTHVAVTKDGNVYTLYINGFKEASKVTSAVLTQSSNPVNMLIGARWNSSGTSAQDFFDGMIDEAAIYDMALSQSQMQELYNLYATTLLIREYKLDESSGTTASDSCGNYNGTTSGSVSWVSGHNDNGLDFDGSSGYVNIGKPDIGIKDFTATAWIKHDTSKAQIIVAQEKSGYTTNQWRLYLTADNKLGFNMSDDTEWGGGLWPFETTDTIPANTWTHVGITKCGNTYTLYINGSVKATKTTDIILIQANNPVNMLIGANWNSSGSGPAGLFDGIIDEVRIYSTPLTAAQMQALYNSY